MTGTDDLRSQEYAALMSQARDLERTSQLAWIAAAVASAVLLSLAIGARSPGLMLPVEVCMAFGYYAVLHARGRSRLIEGYVQEYFESDHDGAQWFSRLSQLSSLPGAEDRLESMPLLLANATMLTAVVFGWVYANGAAHGELLAGLTTMAGVVFSVHSMTEHSRAESARSSAIWSQLDSGLREVTPPLKRAS